MNRPYPVVKQYAYIDESGDLGKGGSTHFAVAAAVVYDPHHLARIIKKVRKNRMHKSLKVLSELKANNTNDVFKRRIFEQIAKSEVEIYAVVLEKRGIGTEVYHSKEALYNRLCGFLVRLLARGRDELEIVLDQKTGNRAIGREIESHLIREVGARSPKTRVTVSQKDSQFTPPLQVADFVVWAVHRKFSMGDARWYDQIKSKIHNAGHELEREE